MKRLAPSILGRRVLAARQARLSSSFSSPSSSSPPPSANAQKSPQSSKDTPDKPSRKTVADLDAELRLKMESISGEGGAAGVEYEDGKAEGLKRGVKSNMFRVI